IPIGGEVWNGPLSKQSNKRLGDRNIRPSLPQRQHRHQVSVAADVIGKLANATRQWAALRIKPEPPILQAIQQPVSQSPLLALFPGLRGPATLVLRSLKQADRRIGGDEI